MANPVSDDPPLRVSVNLSARHFLQSNLLQCAASFFPKPSFPKCTLNIEVTESAMMPDPESAIELMYQLKCPGDPNSARRLRHRIFYPQLSSPLPSRQS